MTISNQSETTLKNRRKLSWRLIIACVGGGLLVPLVVVIGLRRAPSNYACLWLEAATSPNSATQGIPYDSLVLDLASGQWLPRTNREQAAMGYPENSIVITPRVSPDGNYVAYVQPQSYTSEVMFNLVVRTNDVTHRVVMYQAVATEVTEDPGFLWWSPDSRQVAYLGPHGDGPTNIFLTDVAPPHRTSKLPIKVGTGGRFLGWSTDSQYLAMGDWDGKEQIIQILRTDDFQVVMTSQHPQNDPTGDSWGYNYGDGTKWSPRGDWFAYEIQLPASSQVILLSPESGTERVFDLSGSQVNTWTLSWSPKGNYIATLSNKGGSGKEFLDIFGIDGSAFEHIADGVINPNCWDSCRLKELYWTDDEASLTYLDSPPDDGSNLVTFWLKSQRYETVALNLYQSPILVGDGKWFLINPLSSPATDLYPMSSIGLFSLTTRQQITMATFNDPNNVSVSPNHQVVMTWYTHGKTDASPKETWQPGGDGLVWVNIEDGIVHTLETTAPQVAFLDWSVNSEWFTYLVSPDGKDSDFYLGIANATTGESRRFRKIATPLSLKNVDSYQAIPSPDGLYITSVTTFSNSEFRKIDLITVDSGAVLSNPFLGDAESKIVWSPDGTRYAFVAADLNGSPQLVVFSTNDHLLQHYALNPPYQWFQVTSFTQCGPS